MIWLLVPYLCIGGLFAGMAWGLGESRGTMKAATFVVAAGSLLAWPLMLTLGLHLRKQDIAAGRRR